MHRTVMKYIYRLVYIIMPAAIVMAFLYAPPAEGLGESSRLLYVHVPLAWVSVLAFSVSGILSLLFLFTGNGERTERVHAARNSAAIGLLFTVLATFSGSVWSKLSWGAYWNWDPRQTSIIVLMLVYIAYFSLESALRENSSRPRIVSAYLVFAMVTVPFFVFVVPRMFPSLHPDPIINPDRQVHLESAMKISLMTAIAAFTLLYGYILDLANRVSAIKEQQKGHLL